MKKSKPINFHSTSIFGGLYTTIIVFLLFFGALTMFSYVIGDKIVACTAVYIVFILIIYFIERKSLYSSLKSFKQDIKGKLKNVLIVTISLLVIEYIVNLFLLKIIGQAPDNAQSILELTKTSNIVLCIIYFVILCPALESLIFFYPYKNVKHKKVAFVISALLFTMFHITSSANLLYLLYAIPYLLMTFAFSYGFFKTNNIYMSIIAHAINNAVAFMLLLIM